MNIIIFRFSVTFLIIALSAFVSASCTKVDNRHVEFGECIGKVNGSQDEISGSGAFLASFIDQPTVELVSPGCEYKENPVKVISEDPAIDIYKIFKKRDCRNHSAYRAEFYGKFRKIEDYHVIVLEDVRSVKSLPDSEMLGFLGIKDSDIRKNEALRRFIYPCNM